MNFHTKQEITVKIYMKLLKYSEDLLISCIHSTNP